MKKILPLFLVIVLLLVTTVFFYRSQRDIRNPNPVVSWSYTTQDADNGDAPQTTVVLDIDTQKYTVGTYAGTCFDRPREEMGMGEISGVRCWWAGGGDDVWLFLEQGKILLKQRVLDEGTAEEGGVIGEFQILRELSK